MSWILISIALWATLYLLRDFQHNIPLQDPLSNMSMENQPSQIPTFVALA
jgi:hypothetical protein